MKKMLRRLLIVVLVLLALAIIVPFAIHHRMKSRPAWYPVAHLNAADQAAAANRVDQKLIQARSEIAGAYAAQVRQARAGILPSTQPASSNASFSLELTEDEMNSWIPKWKNELGWSAKADRYVTEPAIVLNDQHMILAATVKDWKTIVSLHLLPQLDHGKLRLTIDGVMAGTLPLPKVSWSSYQDRLLSVVQARLPEFRQKARIDAAGHANSAAVSAAMAELLVHTLSNEPAEPVLFLPDQMSKAPRSLPVRITGVDVANKTLTLSVQPMDSAERTALLQHLQGVTDQQTAMGPARDARP